MAFTAHLPSVTSADFVRHFGRWQDRVGSSPVLVTSHGRDRMVIISIEQYQALLARESKPAPQEQQASISPSACRSSSPP